MQTVKPVIKAAVFQAAEQQRAAGVLFSESSAPPSHLDSWKELKATRRLIGIPADAACHLTPVLM